MNIDRKKVELAMARGCLTRHEVAKRGGLSAGVVNNLKLRERGLPETIGKLAKGLGVDVSEILADEN